jgi:hypothetical protein
MSARKSSAKRGVRRGRTPFELGVLVVSIAAVGAIVVGLVVAGVSGPDGPPNLRAIAHPTGEQRSGGSVYEVTITNGGGETAENVVLEVVVADETREIEILSVSKGDDETVTTIFPPGTTGPATVEILSYHSTTRG